MTEGLFETQTNLKQTLLDHLPSHTKGFFSKEGFSTNFTFEETHTIIDTANFLRYNTKKFTNILIFDLDHFPNFQSKPTLKIIHDHFYNLTGFEPSWTLQTDRGYHIALILSEGIFNTWKNNTTQTNDYKTVIELKRQISLLLDADNNASNKTCAIWRNPLTHKHIFTGKKYALTELLSEFNISIKKKKPITGQLISNEKTVKMKMKMQDNNKILNMINDGFYIGNRNKYLFAYGYKKLFENRDLFNSLENILLAENNNHPNPLTQNEVSAITNSILKLSESMYQSYTMIERGKLSDLMWKLNIHGISKRRAFAGWTTSKERREKTLSAITDVLVEQFQNGKLDYSNTALAKDINRSVKTVQRYKQAYNIKGLIFKLWCKANAKLAASAENLKNQIDIRPFVHRDAMKEFKYLFFPFSPTISVLDLDAARKKAYLERLYPLTG